ncbi:RNA-binding domain superfamily [Sesbania bispinosa]|nr:RNA-binding domain superfamily [Sesbania bispinosa]
MPAIGPDGKKKEPESNVLLATIENMQYAVTVDVLHTVFYAFGTVQKIAIFEKNGQTQVLIQYPDVTTAVTAKEALEGHCIYDGGYYHIISRPNIPTKRRNTTSSSSFIPPPTTTETVMVNSVVDNNARETVMVNSVVDNIARETVMVNSVVDNIARETVIVNSVVDNIPRHCKGRRSRAAKKTTTTEQKRQNSEVGQTSTIEIDPPLHEGSDRMHIQEDEQVFYKLDDRNEGIAAAVGLRGRITRGGILCSCCQKEMSVWSFERHANSDHRKPYERIYILQTQENLQDCLIVVWHHSTERERREELCFSTLPVKTLWNVEKHNSSRAMLKSRILHDVLFQLNEARQQ